MGRFSRLLSQKDRECTELQSLEPETELDAGIKLSDHDASTTGAKDNPDWHKDALSEA